MSFSFSFVSGGQIFGVFFAPFPEEEISDSLARGSFIRVLAVCQRVKNIGIVRSMAAELWLE